MPPKEKFLIAWLFFINFLGIFFVCIDKMRAKQRRWRVPEHVLFLLAVLGGTSGVYLTMLLIRHKTRHKRFMIGLPLIFLAQGLIILFWFQR